MGVNVRNGLIDLNLSGELLLDFCASYILLKQKSLSSLRVSISACDTMTLAGGQRRTVIVPFDLWSCVMNTGVKRGMELSSCHHLVVWWVLLEEARHTCQSRLSTPKFGIALTWYLGKLDKMNLNGPCFPSALSIWLFKTVAVRSLVTVGVAIHKPGGQRKNGMQLYWRRCPIETSWLVKILNWQSNQHEAAAIAVAKTLVWKEIWEAIEKDFNQPRRNFGKQFDSWVRESCCLPMLLQVQVVSCCPRPRLKTLRGERNTLRTSLILLTRLMLRKWRLKTQKWVSPPKLNAQVVKKLLVARQQGWMRSTWVLQVSGCRVFLSDKPLWHCHRASGLVRRVPFIKKWDRRVVDNKNYLPEKVYFVHFEYSPVPT